MDASYHSIIYILLKNYQKLSLMNCRMHYQKPGMRLSLALGSRFKSQQPAQGVSAPRPPFQHLSRVDDDASLPEVKEWDW